ncbi:menaquinone biosynthetic enzyme MqnA/MqnD family protein [Rosistilla oblonga]|uniref:menaquinone biosynthetic enzyme MqnA/MqnD family protein n=1 Tax=Rosistilla oblonga TaxID=2527990 RepID=UPI003A97CC2E
MDKLRIGAVSYLNTKPLVYGIQQRLPGAEVVFDLPSRLADQLHAGQLDVALIPSVEYFRHADDYEIVSDACIACRGPVWSVRLLSRVPVPEIKTLALDEGSRTSAALVQVLLKQQYGLTPELHPLPIDASPDALSTDAVLLIGDRAMHPTTGLYQEIWDLGDRWCSWSKLPFVFAMWIGRRGVDHRELADALQHCRDAGMEHLQQLATEHAGTHGLTVSDCFAYLSRYLHFTLGDEERQGLELYRTKATELGLIAS